MSKLDDRIWLTDFNDIMDWEAVKKGLQTSYGNKATWWVQATPGVNYYRAELPARHLPGKTIRFDTWDATLMYSDGEPSLHFAEQEGPAVWLFPGTTTKAVLMAEMVLQGIKCMVEVDDNYLTHPPIPVLSEWRTTMPKLPDDTPSYECHKRIVTSKACDGVICSTPYLADIYSKLHSNVHVCPNSVDPDDWNPDPPHQKDGVLHIGWAGSASHGYDIAEIFPALSWAAQQDKVEVVVLGDLDFPFAHTNIPWTDSLAQYRRNVEHLDVILCPIRPNYWANGKSDVKALEGVMGGALPVVSRTEPFRPWWDKGYVAETKKDWKKILKHLILNRDEVRQGWQDARKYVLAERTIQKNVGAWRTALA